MAEKQLPQTAPSSGVLVPVRPASRITFTPRTDVLENETEFLLFSDLPGVRPEDVEVRFEKGELSLHGKCAPRSFGNRRQRGEYEVGDFYRVFSLSEHIDVEKISAELANGVLTVRLPKVEAVKPKRIAVQGK